MIYAASLAGIVGLAASIGVAALRVEAEGRVAVEVDDGEAGLGRASVPLGAASPFGPVVGGRGGGQDGQDQRGGAPQDGEPVPGKRTPFSEARLHEMLAVARDIGAPYVLPSVETVNAGSYPISRPLYMYTAGEPTGS